MDVCVCVCVCVCACVRLCLFVATQVRASVCECLIDVFIRNV